MEKATVEAKGDGSVAHKSPMRSRPRFDAGIHHTAHDRCQAALTHQGLFSP